WTPLANATISPAWTLSRPWMRAMPSPTESTEPTSETCASVPKLAIWSRMTLEISAARISMRVPLAFHRLGERVETRADRAVDALRTDGDDQAAEQVGIDAGLELDGAAFAGAELLLQRRKLLVGERVGAGDFGADFAALSSSDGLERANHRGQLGRAAVLRQHAEEVARQIGELERFAKAREDLAERVAADLRVADQRAQLGRFAQRLGERLEIGFDRADETALAGKIEQGRGITPCQAGLNTGGKLHARRSSLGPENGNFRPADRGLRTAPRQGWRAPSKG